MSPTTAGPLASTEPLSTEPLSTEALSADVRESTVLAEIAQLLRAILDEYGLDDIEIGMDTGFYDDLELESMDLVTLAGKLEAFYGGRVNFAEFVADLGLEEIIALTVGQLVEYVADTLRHGEG